MAEAFADGLSNINPQVRLVLWGDSHLANNHFFPTEFQDLISFPGSRYSPNLINNSVGGKRLNPLFITQVQQFAGNQENSQHYVHIFSLGGNNIRDCFRQGSAQDQFFRAQQTVYELLTSYETILNFLTIKPKTQVLLVAPFPSAHPNHEIHFEWLGIQLENLAQQKGAHFARVRDLLSITVGLDQNGLAIRQHSPALFHDDVHLNHAGAKLVAQSVFKTLNHIPNSVFGYYKLRGNRK